MTPTEVNGLLLWGPVAPARLGVWLDDGRVPNDGRVREHVAAVALERSRAALVFPGPMFDAAAYAEGAPATLRYRLRDRARRIDHGGLASTDAQGASLCVAGGVATLAHGDPAPDGADVIVQGYPTLVEDGAVVTSIARNRERVWRPGVGVLRNGELVLALAHGSMTGLATGLYQYGCVGAVHLDGGGSGRVAYYDAGGLQRHAGSSEDRALASWLTVAP